MTNTQESDINPEEDLYYFETDHLALRGNKDYSEVLKNLLILCAQRKQAIKDYNTAVELKKEALADPAKVLEKIIKGESLGMPDMHCMPELPVIDWSKYDIKIPEESFKLIYSDGSESVKKKHETPKKETKISHGKWTTEEQKRLEELLQIYPPEPVEMRRFKKIADALGNRTIQQVTSRIQKYFVKLYKAGLPIPGRIPKSAEKHKRTSLHKHQRHNHYLWKPTTFFPDLCVPVVMNDLDNVPGPSSKIPDDITQPSTSSNYLIPSVYHQESEILPQKSESELQLELLKRIRKVKVRDNESGSNFQHVGFKCDYCNDEPIIGTRWHCNTCKSDSIDFCTDCVLTQIYSDNSHPLNHNLIACGDREIETDSESNSGSLDQNNESSDEEMSDISDNVKDQVMANGMDESEKIVDKNQCEEMPKLEFGNYGSDEFGAGLGSDLFSEIENLSYNYLHSNLLLDKD